MKKTLNDLRIKNRAGKPDYYVQEIYPRYLPPRTEKVKLLEIGVERGRSIRMWAEYFPKGNIYGIEIDPHRKFEQDRVEIFIGDQADPVLLEEVVTKSGELDIVIDDGSHHSKDMIASFEYLWPYVKPGGIYVIEDIECTFWPTRGGGYNKEGTILEYLRDLIENVIPDKSPGEYVEANSADIPPRVGIDFVAFHSNVAVIRKEDDS